MSYSLSKKCLNIHKIDSRVKQKILMMKLSLLIKQVQSHPPDRLACKTRDMYDDMETVDYNPPEDVELSDAETVQ